ncbi:hypothetical protein [Streptomyces sp. SPB162]|nr:hypothetical protein [Streptomyces sp. SPB162]MDF9816649.1 hypothetical protein [Streptomyces sp. SPB162]
MASQTCGWGHFEFFASNTATSFIPVNVAGARHRGAVSRSSVNCV